MFVGILFTMLVSSVIGTFSFLTFWNAYHARPEYTSKPITAYAYFWLGMAGTWFATAGIDFFQYLHERQMAIVCTYILQIFVGASLVAAAYFFAGKLLPTRFDVFASAIYTLWYVCFLISLFWYRVTPQPENYFVGQILTSSVTIMLFVGAFTPLWVGAWILLVRSFRRVSANERSMRRFALLAALSFILIGASGFVDEVGLVYSWMVTVARLCTLVASIVAFASTWDFRHGSELEI